jgi:hypothetical protein
MNRRLIAGTMVVAASMLMSEAAFAAPLAGAHSPVLAMFSHEKMVSFSIRNATSTSITLKAGDKEMTVAPGQTVPIKLPVGAKVIAVNDTPNHAPGSVVAEAESRLSDATIVLN